MKSFAFIFIAAIAVAQEYETVVEKTIFNSSSLVIIDEETIRETKAPDLISLITTQANITLFNNNFQPPQLFIRGGESSHVLFMIDNVPAYDVSWAQKTLNLNSLDIRNVRRIEIIKGGQTVLYGGQALAGVIKIFTFGKQFQNQRKVTATVSLPDDHKSFADDRRLGVAAESQISDSEGFMANVRLMQRRNQSPVLDSKKLYKQSNRNLDLGYEKRGSISTQLRGYWFLDDSYNPTTVNNMGQQSIADSDVRRYDEQFGISSHFHFHEVSWQPQLSLYGQSGRRFFYSPTTSADVNARFRSGYQGIRLDLLPYETEKVQIRTGLNYQKEDFFLDDSTATLSVQPRTADRFDETRGAFVHARWLPSQLFLFEVGARTEKVRGFSEQNSSQVGLTIANDTKLEWVTGYRAPSASQRFGIFPNTDLKPETSETVSLTHDWRYSDRGEASLTIFETKFDDYIEARSIGMGVLQYQNTAEVRTQGIETSGSYALDEANTLQISYAYQDPRDLVRDERLRRRPLDSGTVRVIHNQDKWGGTIEATGIGTRRDFFGASRYKFAGYMLVNSSLRYKADEKDTYSLRISNWFDTRPQVSIDFYGEGRQMLVSWERIF